MMEVMKSGPPTPSTVSSHPHPTSSSNGVAPPLSLPPAQLEPSSLGTVENGNGTAESDVIAAPPSFDEVVTPTEKGITKEGKSQEFQPPVEKPHGMGKGTFTRMRSLVAIQLAGGSVDAEDGQDNDTPNGIHAQSGERLNK